MALINSMGDGPYQFYGGGRAKQCAAPPFCKTPGPLLDRIDRGPLQYTLLAFIIRTAYIRKGEGAKAIIRC